MTHTHTEADVFSVYCTRHELHVEPGVDYSCHMIPGIEFIHYNRDICRQRRAMSSSRRKLRDVTTGNAPSVTLGLNAIIGCLHFHVAIATRCSLHSAPHVSSHDSIVAFLDLSRVVRNNTNEIKTIVTNVMHSDSGLQFKPDSENSPASRCRQLAR